MIGLSTEVVPRLSYNPLKRQVMKLARCETFIPHSPVMDGRRKDANHAPLSKKQTHACRCIAPMKKSNQTNAFHGTAR